MILGNVQTPDESSNIITINLQSTQDPLYSEQKPFKSNPVVSRFLPPCPGLHPPIYQMM